MKRGEAAKIIDHEWRYSWHWGDYEWESQAFRDARSRLSEAKRELEMLEQCVKILEGQVDDLLD